MANYGGAWGSMGSYGDLVYGADGADDADPEKQGFFQKLTEAFAPGTPGAATVKEGISAISSAVQQEREKLSSLKARLTAKQQRLKTAKRPRVRARLQGEIESLLGQIAALQSAMRESGSGISLPPAKPALPGWLPFAAIGATLLAVFGGAWFFMRRRRKGRK